MSTACRSPEDHFQIYTAEGVSDRWTLVIAVSFSFLLHIASFSLGFPSWYLNDGCPVFTQSGEPGTLMMP